jgi:hypothetical protein
MGIIIIILLLLAIGLLLYNIGSKSKIDRATPMDQSITRFPDIIGKPNLIGRQSVTKAANEGTNKRSIAVGFNFDSITEVKPSEVPQEEPGDITGEPPDWKEEEEELERYAGFSSDDGLATGVTFDELATVGRLLERRALDPSEKDIAVSMMVKIDGTELLDLLESRVGDVSRKIAVLLDRELT